MAQMSQRYSKTATFQQLFRRELFLQSKSVSNERNQMNNHPYLSQTVLFGTRQL